MYHNKDGIALTDSRTEARQYRIQDDDPFVKQQGYVKFCNFFSYDRSKRIYTLPVRFAKPKKMGMPIDVEMGEIVPYDYQQGMLDRAEMLSLIGEKSMMGISGTATGKSIILLGLIHLFKQKTCIVVPNKSIAKGLLEKFEGHCNAEIIVSKDIEKKDPDVAIVVAQSFNRVYEQLNKRYSILLLDEIHKMPAKRVEQINNRVGEFVCGVTATPQRKGFGLDGFKIMFGNIYDTKKEKLPVAVYKYPYNYNYSNNEIDIAMEDLSPDSPEIYRRLYINNEDRLVHLGGIIKRLRGKGYKKIIIFTDRVAHAEKIKEFLGEGFLMTGKKKEREFQDQDEYIIIGMSQAVGEGFDIPPLEVGILYMSTRWINTLEQTAGRMRREFGNKTKAVYVDFADSLQIEGGKKKVLGWYDRNKLYKEKGREVLDFNNDI